MAASMVEEGYPDKLEGFNFKKFRIIKQIYSDIKETEFRRLAIRVKRYYYEETEYARICPIPWSIEQTEEIFKNFIEPWKPPNYTYFEEGIKKHKAWLAKISHINAFHKYGIVRGCQKLLDLVDPDKADKRMKELIGTLCPHCDKEIKEDAISDETGNHLIPVPYWSFFWEVSQYLDFDGFKRFRTAFHEWARNECGKAIMAMGSLVSANIYDEVIKELKSSPDESKESKSKTDKWEEH